MLLRNFIIIFLLTISSLNGENVKKVAYLVDNIEIPFWEIVSKGIKDKAKEHGYHIDIFSSNHSTKNELSNLSKIIKSNYSGLIISPTNSSNAVTILRIAKENKLPVVIADIGTEEGEYVSYISSNNYKGAFGVGKALIKEVNHKKCDLGIIAIPQTRENGKQRTKGFLDAIKGTNHKPVGIKQLKKWDDKESYEFTKEFIEKYPNLKIIWIQTSNIYKGVLQAIKDLDKSKDISLLAFDAEPEFLELIKNNEIVASGMQQPFLIGETAFDTMFKYLKGEKVKKNIQLDILIVTPSNIERNLSLIKKNVFGLKLEK